jgi:tetratricopeptide (TPR) repeat protein
MGRKANIGEGRKKKEKQKFKAVARILFTDYRILSGLVGTILIIVVTVIGWFVLRGCPTKNFDEKVVFDIAQKLLDKYGQENRRLVGELCETKEQVGQMKEQVANALRRAQVAENRENTEGVKGIIEELRKSGDTSRLLDFLVKERAAHRDELIELNHEIAAVAYLRGDIDIAMAATDEVLLLQPNDVISLNQRGHIFSLRGELDEAEKAYLRVKELRVEAGDEQWQAAALGNLGVIYGTRGQLDKAKEMFLKIVEIHRKLGSREGLANDYGNLGVIYQRRGELDKAEEMLNKSLEIA